MYFDTYLEYQNQIRNDMIEKQMHNYKTEAVASLSSIIAQEYKTRFTESLIQILAYSYKEELPDAMRLADQLDLNKLHFLAVMDLKEEFEELYIDQQEMSYYSSHEKVIGEL